MQGELQRRFRQGKEAAFNWFEVHEIESALGERAVLPDLGNHK